MNEDGKKRSRSNAPGHRLPFTEDEKTVTKELFDRHFGDGATVRLTIAEIEQNIVKKLSQGNPGYKWKGKFCYYAHWKKSFEKEKLDEVSALETTEDKSNGKGSIDEDADNDENTEKSQKGTGVITTKHEKHPKGNATNSSEDDEDDHSKDNAREKDDGNEGEDDDGDDNDNDNDRGQQLQKQRQHQSNLETKKDGNKKRKLTENTAAMNEKTGEGHSSSSNQSINYPKTHSSKFDEIQDRHEEFMKNYRKTAGSSLAAAMGPSARHNSAYGAGDPSNPAYAAVAAAAAAAAAVASNSVPQFPHGLPPPFHFPAFSQFEAPPRTVNPFLGNHANAQSMAPTSGNIKNNNSSNNNNSGARENVDSDTESIDGNVAGSKAAMRKRIQDLEQELSIRKGHIANLEAKCAKVEPLEVMLQKTQSQLLFIETKVNELKAGILSVEDFVFIVTAAGMNRNSHMFNSFFPQLSASAFRYF